MAKGDKKKYMNQLDYRSAQVQPGITQLQDQTGGQTNQLWGRFQTAADKGNEDYGSIMGRYQAMLDDPKNNVTYNRTPEIQKSMDTYRNFADTGGYSDADVRDLRERGVSPIRAVYANAQQGVNRQRALQGGYSPSYNATIAKMAREQAPQLANATTNVNAGLAEQIRNGRLAGASGLSQTGFADVDAAMKAMMANNANRNNTLSGMTSLYGTTPGAANMFGNMALNSTGQQMNAQQMQQQLMEAIMNGQANYAQIPGNFGQAMNNIGSAGRVIGQIGGGLMGIPQFGGNTGIVKPGVGGVAGKA